MKSIKGIALGAALAGVVFAGAAQADAAVVGKDTVGTKYETATNKLAALGITKGYPDGTVRPDENVTRAQTAAFMVRALNYQLALDQSTTAFSDVGYDHPLSGAVQLATGKGIIKGYLDGTFRAEENVTVAQAAAILVRMLGYSPAINEADFPNSHLSKAAELGILKGVAADANAPAKRGDIMIMVANALTVDIMEQDEWGTDQTWTEQDDQNILTEYFDITIFDDTEHSKNVDAYGPMLEVNNVARVDLDSLKVNEIQFAEAEDSDEGAQIGTSTVYELNSIYDPSEWLGQEVTAWVDTDEDFVYYVEASEDQEVIYDEITDDATDGVYLDDEDDDYTINEDAKIWFGADSRVYEYKNDVTDADLDKAPYNGAKVKVVLNDDDEVVAMVVTPYDEAEYGVVKAVDTTDESVEFIDDTNSEGGKLDLDGDDYVVVKDGAPAELADIEEGDVLNYFFNDGDEDQVYIVATSTKVEGTVEDVEWTSSDLNDHDVTVNGEDYTVAFNATWSDDGNDTSKELEPEDVEDMDGEDVTLYIDAQGEIRHIVSGEIEGGVDQVGVLTEAARWLNDAEEIELKFVNEQGKEVEFSFEEDEVELTLADGTDLDDEATKAQWLNALSFADDSKLVAFEYDLDKDGNLKSIEILGDVGTSTDVDFDEDDNTVKVDGEVYNVTSRTTVFDVTDDLVNGEIDDVNVVSWESVSGEDDVEEAAYVIKSNGEDLEYLFVLDTAGALSSGGEYGVISGFTTVDGDDAVRVVTPDGESVDYVYEDADIYSEVAGVDDTLAKKQFIRFELDADGEIEEAYILAANGGPAMTAAKPSIDIDLAKSLFVEDTSSKTIQGTDKDGKAANVPVNSNTVYFNLDDKKVVSGADEDDWVLVIDTDDDGNAADFVIIVKEDAEKGDVTGNPGDNDDPVDPPVDDEYTVELTTEASQLMGYKVVRVNLEGVNEADYEVVVDGKALTYNAEAEEFVGNVKTTKTDAELKAATVVTAK